MEVWVPYWGFCCQCRQSCLTTIHIVDLQAVAHADASYKASNNGSLGRRLRPGPSATIL